MGLLQLLLEGEGSFRPSSDKPRFSPEKEGPVYRSVQGQVLYPLGNRQRAPWCRFFLEVKRSTLSPLVLVNLLP
eukprot:849672-Pelagomonas_calceolata.AAC.1